MTEERESDWEAVMRGLLSITEYNRRWPAVKPYDGSKYRTVSYFECDCGFKVPTGPMNIGGVYPGSKEMVEHLEMVHGYVSPYAGS